MGIMNKTVLCRILPLSKPALRLISCSMCACYRAFSRMGEALDLMISLSTSKSKKKRKEEERKEMKGREGEREEEI